jgi:hypothetical protein
LVGGERRFHGPSLYRAYIASQERILRRRFGKGHHR